MSVATAMGQFGRAVRGNRTALVSGSILLLIAAVAIIGPFVSPHNYRNADFAAGLTPPVLENAHWFGTDDLGRDLFTRTMLGTKISLTVAIVASLVSLIIGVLYGAIAGYAGGRIDAVMMRIVDTLYAVPFIFFVILLMVYFERNFFLIFVAIGAVNWLDMARIVRGQTLSLKEREFIDAARLIGVKPLTIIFRHITPNLMSIVVVYLTLTVPQAMLVESFLSYLGLGVQEPQTSLGTLANVGVRQMEQAPWLLIPAGLLALILLCFNFLGDGLRDIADPRSTQEDVRQ